MNILIWAINGLLALLGTIAAYLFNDMRNAMKELRLRQHSLANDQQSMKLHQTTCVTRDELDKKFDSLRRDMREQHEETVTTMRAINSRIDDYMSKPRFVTTKPSKEDSSHE